MEDELQKLKDEIAELRSLIEDGHNHDGDNSLKTSDNGNQGTILSDDTKNALDGSSGTPSESNKFITEDDVDTDATADKIVRRDGDGAITVPETPDADSEAASKGYTDSVCLYTTASDVTQARKQSGISLPEQVSALLSGRVRVKLYIKSTDPSYGTYSIYAASEIDSVTDQVSYQTHTYITEELDVLAGDTIIITGTDIDIDDIQINYDVNVEVTNYSEFL